MCQREWTCVRVDVCGTRWFPTDEVVMDYKMADEITCVIVRAESKTHKAGMVYHHHNVVKPSSE